uniref:Peptidase S8 n=1 Tax=Caenorhabditis tropicalis TaxID=1561998 RepID=A0A1I7TT02_9PELO
MRPCIAVLFLLLIAFCHVADARPYDFYDVIVDDQPRIVYKRANGGNQQELVMARLQQLLGPEAFTEIDSHGRLSNLQRLG